MGGSFVCIVPKQENMRTLKDKTEIDLGQSNASQSYHPITLSNDLGSEFSSPKSWTSLLINSGLTFAALLCASWFAQGWWSDADSYAVGTDRPILQFHAKESNESGDDSETWTFKIAQITDIHLGEAESTFGPEQDLKTWLVMDKVLTTESPDFIVLSGDQLTANNCKNNATAYYQLLGEFLSRYEIPWAMVFGNHDDMDYEVPGGNTTIPVKYSRDDLLTIDQSFPLSLSQGGPRDVTGTTNYFLNVHIGDKAVAQIVFLDSGGGSLEEAIDESQVQWFREQASSSKLPGVAFQHIPTSGSLFSDYCSGFQGEGIEALHYDAGILEALVDAGRFSFLAAGHNHGNDYCCPYKDTDLVVCFGRHSGHGGYGKWERGSRIYELAIPKVQSSKTKPMMWKSWVRLESGRVVDEVSILGT